MKLTSLMKQTSLQPGVLAQHRQRNRRYLMELKTDHLLCPYWFEAGLFRCELPSLEGFHMGWDGPLSDLRGQFTGHWLAAAARLIENTGDPELKLKADHIVDEMARCQRENGGEWGFSIPEKHLWWLRNGKRTWAPQYVCHKEMMGLLAMYRYAGNQQALEIVLKEADWFDRFSADIDRERMSDMMDWEETGGLMELWADLYETTRDPRHLALMRRYERPRLTEPLLRHEDVLSNLHANTTIPEIHGAARAYEVTGEERYRRVVEAYWALAVDERDAYATGGQTCGEIWTPPGRIAARLGDSNQEHCVVYNMMRLADYLLRWTGDMKYADYMERNLWNGILAQGFGDDCLDQGIVCYYLGLAAGSRKNWGSQTQHFWCCHGTAVQANAELHGGIFYRTEDGILICQYQPASVSTEVEGVPVTVDTALDTFADENIRIRPVQREYPSRPNQLRLLIHVQCERPASFALRIRMPWWRKGETVVTVNGQRKDAQAMTEGGCLVITGPWTGNDQVTVSFGKGITCQRTPDAPNTVAFLDGPVVLAGLCEEERTLQGDPEHPEALLVPHNERWWQEWSTLWKTTDQPVNLRFQPLWQIGKQPYTVYFPVEKAK